MAKKSIGRNGKILSNTKEKLNIILDKMERETFKENNKHKPVAGIKQEIIEAYKKTCSKEEAYKRVEAFNKKIGQEAFTKDMVDQWLKPYEETTIKSREDDDDAR